MTSLPTPPHPTPSLNLKTPGPKRTLPLPMSKLVTFTTEVEIQMIKGETQDSGQWNMAISSILRTFVMILHCFDSILKTQILN